MPASKKANGAGKEDSALNSFLTKAVSPPQRRGEGTPGKRDDVARGRTSLECLGSCPVNWAKAEGGHAGVPRQEVRRSSSRLRAGGDCGGLGSEAPRRAVLNQLLEEAPLPGTQVGPSSGGPVPAGGRQAGCPGTGRSHVVVRGQKPRGRGVPLCLWDSLCLGEVPSKVGTWWGQWRWGCARGQQWWHSRRNGP